MHLFHALNEKAAEQTLLIMSANPFHARGLVARLRETLPAEHLTLLVTNPPPADTHPFDPLKQATTVDLAHVERADAVFWAEPHPDDMPAAVPHLARLLEDGAPLAVITRGWLSRYLSEVRRSAHALPPPVSASAVARLLAASGFALHEQIALRGANALLWDILSRTAGRLGRPDLADRLGYKMRAEMVAPVWARPLATLTVIIGQKTA